MSYNGQYEKFDPAQLKLRVVRYAKLLATQNKVRLRCLLFKSAVAEGISVTAGLLQSLSVRLSRLSVSSVCEHVSACQCQRPKPVLLPTGEVRLPVCLSVCLVCLSVCLSVCEHVSACQCQRPKPVLLPTGEVRLPVCLSVCLSVCMSVCLSVCLSVNVCQHVSVSVPSLCCCLPGR